MLFSRRWLADYLELPPDDAELARRLTAAGLAVEGLEARDGDTLLDVDVTTNRPDCMNHLGVARELAALLGRRCEWPAVPERADGPAPVPVEIAAGAVEACPRYVAVVVRGVRVGPSPAWLSERLTAIGLRPINNVVDVTNFVLWECGQPLHAFDLSRLTERRVQVRWAVEGEELVTLDGERRCLDGGTLVIADAARAVALAGLMGGLDTEVTGATTEVLLESAHFAPRAVRHGARRLDLHTDASHRFERGGDPELCRWAADRAASLLVALAGGEIVDGTADERSGDWSDRWRLAGELDVERLAAFAGHRIEPAEVAATLAALGFGVEPIGQGRWHVGVPSWRYYDFKDGPAPGRVYAADLYEEVLRLHGFDRIPSALPALAGPDAGTSAAHRRRSAIRRSLAAWGWSEVVNFAFHDGESERALPAIARLGEPLVLANPLSDRYRVMRRSLFPGLVASAGFNLRRQAPAVRLFELGNVFPGSEAEERESVGLIAGGRQGTPWEHGFEIDLFDLKGAIESLAAGFGRRFGSRSASRPGIVEGTGAELVDEEGAVVGVLGRIDGIDAPVPLFAGELLVSALEPAVGSRHVRLPSRFPAVEADLTLTHPRSVPWAELEAEILAAAVPDLAAFHLKDRFEGKGVPPGSVNTTIAFLYNAADRSLTQEEVNERHAALGRRLEERFGRED